MLVFRKPFKNDNFYDINQIVSISNQIRSSCGYWLEVSNKSPIFHLELHNISNILCCKRCNCFENSVLNTSSIFNKKINEFFTERGFLATPSNSINVFGINPFVNTNNVFVIFPIGEFNFTWSCKVKSITGWFALHQDRIKKFQCLLKTYKNTDLCKALKSGNEILISCPEYYSIPYSIWMEIKKGKFL